MTPKGNRQRGQDASHSPYPFIVTDARELRQRKKGRDAIPLAFRLGRIHFYEEAGTTRLTRRLAAGAAAGAFRTRGKRFAPHRFATCYMPHAAWVAKFLRFSNFAKRPSLLRDRIMKEGATLR